MKTLAHRLILVALLWSACPLFAQTATPDLVLQGSLRGTQNKTYFEVPFRVPAGTHRVSVDFSYTGRDHKTTLDLGVADPFRFRGYSGGNKSHFTIGESDATPSYLPGPIPAGMWKLLISVPNIRPTEHDAYRAEVRFNSKREDQGFSTAPLETGTRWYRGDLHMHTAHSDGSCASQSGKRVPCPVFLTAQSAVTHGLDFIAITDHNATSQYNSMRELQPYFDRLLLIPGREMTTFWGHFNIFGVTRYIDYRVGPHQRDVNAILRDVRAAGGIASVNHAESPTGESCMGCGWEPTTAIDMHLFTGAEVFNGGRSGLFSDEFWNHQLAAGNRLTGIGGSDSHNGAAQRGESGSVGEPTTVVEASELSVPAILESIRLGRVFIDRTGSRDKVLDLDARDTASNASVRMGGTLQAAAEHTISFRVHIAASPDSTVHLFLDGNESPSLPALSTGNGTQDLPFQWTSDGKRHWLRAEVRDAQDALTLISNPIYINATER